MNITIAITGASGTIYAMRLLDRLSTNSRVEKIAVIVSRSGYAVGKYETGEDLSERIQTYGNATVYDDGDMFAPVASGSAAGDAMIIVPCSMGTVGRIAGGISDSLITRAADVMLKERRKLIIVPRETPLSLIHLENLTKLTRAGAIIMPASPSFYSRPETIAELSDTVTERIAAHLGLEGKEDYRWQGNV